MTKRFLFLIFLLLLTINGILVYSNISNSEYNVEKIIKNAELLKIRNNQANCEDYKEEIKRDNEYIYYLSCIKSDEVTIKYLDGDEYTLKELITKNYLSINDLIKAGLIVEKSPIKINNKENTDENNDNKESTLKPNNNFEDKEPSNPKNENKVILSYDEILEYNKKIINKTDTLYNLEDYKNLSVEQIKKLIEKYTLPTFPKYNGDDILSLENTKSILDNRNLENIEVSIKKGIIVSRANLRSFPTNIHFYDTKNKQDFDRLQETELHVNTPVLILHTSKDNIWQFVICPFYMGWVEAKNIAYATNEDLKYFIDNQKFGIITDASVNINGINLDMSVKLPLVGETDDNLNLILPSKDTNGNIVKKPIAISRKSVNVGYLLYTKENVIKQAEKYLGVNYSWGGMDSGVDCSSFISNVYRTFGFSFPRNTSSQNQSVGAITNLSEKSSDQKLEIIKNTEPSLLFQSGHVMLYIGIENNKQYIIHASGSTMLVTKTILANSSYLKNINKLVLVGK